MTDRLERVQAHVLNYIADDYEEIGQIMIDLDHWSSELRTSREEVRTALAGLIQAGLAKAYFLGDGGHGLDGVPDAETFEDHYFYITPKGIETLSTFPEEWFLPLAGDDSRDG
jgi:hypothetical protein